MAYRLTRTIVLGILASSASCGCGSTTDGSPNAAGAAAVAGAAGTTLNGGGGAAASSGDGSGSGGRVGGASGAAGDRGASDSIGTVQVLRALPGEPQAGAMFDLVEQAAWNALGTSTCVIQNFGDCVLTKCPISDTDPPSVPNAPSLVRYDAGTITITADTAPFSATGMPVPDKVPYVFQASGSLGGGEILTVAATGGTISAFTGTFTVPLAPLLLAPSIDGMTGTIDVPVPRTADFTIRWDARGASDQIQSVVRFPVDAPVDTGNTYLSCTFASAAGAATLQAGALTQLPAGTRIRLFAVNRRTLQTAQGSVKLVAGFEMISQDKTSYPSLVLQ